MAGQDVAYDPLWNAGRTGKGWSRGKKIAVGLSIAAHLGLFYYIYETKFTPHYATYGEEPVTTIDIRPLPKHEEPPPPPPPTVKQESPPPQKLTPHVAEIPPLAGVQPPPPIPLAALDPPAPVLPPPPVAQDPPKPPPPKVIANPDWSSRPNGDDMARYYPERAQRLDRSGNVTLQCQVTAKGGLANCAVAAEDPADFGFGDAALKLSRLFKMKPKMEDGQAIEGASVKIPIAFRLSSN